MSAAPQTLTIGRGRDSGILLTHSSISRRHAELTITDGGAQIRDLQSTGGTFLIRGGKEILVSGDTPLKPSDTVRLGDYEISGKDLLSLVPEESSVVVRDSGGNSSKRLAPASGGPAIAKSSGPAPGKLRMMRCSCGSIKERGKPCPDCGL